MSTSIEDRIVEMQFDNAQFEQGAKTTMNTLKDLDNSLKFENGAKGFAAISEAASRVDLSSLIGGVESVGHSFSALEVAAITVISRITSAIMDAVMGISRELLVKPISEGYQEYETKMDMVQTTMVNSGKSLEEVNATLDDLNHYADKTIFKFMDMTQALKKFTMAGITDLDVAKTMIEGIGNIAGEAGLKTEQASSAFYMISQAMSQGKMSLYQFRTLESTGFASVKFRQNLLDTAVALGKIKDVGNGVYSALTDKGKVVEFTIESLRNNLTNTGWFDKEVMEALFSRYASEEANIALGFEDISKAAFAATTDVKTFSQMWDTLKEAAQSGWTTSWETIVGDYEQSKQLWTSVNNVISGILDRQSDQRNKMLSDWAKFGGRTAALEGIANLWRAINDIIEKISNNFRYVFPSVTGERLAEISKGFQELIEKLSPSTETLKYIGITTRILADTLKKVFDTIKYGWGIVKMAFNDIFPTGLIDRFVDKFEASRKLFGIYIKAIQDKSQVFLVNFSKIRRIFRGLFAVVDIGINLITSLVEAFMPLVQKIFPKASGGITELIAKFGDFLVSARDWIVANEIFKKIFEGMANGIEAVISGFAKAIDFLKRVFGPAWNILKSAFKEMFDKDDIEGTKSFFDTLVGALKTLVTGLAKAIAKLMPILKVIAEFVGTTLKNVAQKIGDFFKDINKNSMGVSTALTAAVGTLLGANGLWHIIDGIGDFFSAAKDWSQGIKGVLINLDDLLGGFNELKDQFKFEMIARSLKQVAIAVGVLAVSFILLSMCDMEKVGAAFLIMTNALFAMVGAMAALNAISKGGDVFGMKSPIMTMTSALLEFAAGILVMSIALSILSKVDPDRLTVSLTALSAMMYNMVFIAKMLGNQESGFKKAAQSLTKMSVAMAICAVAVKILSKIDTKSLIKGVLAFTFLITIMSTLYAVLSAMSTEKLAGIGASFIAISVAMVIMSKAVSTLGSIPILDLIKGLYAVVAIIAVVGVMSSMLGSNAKNVVLAGIGMMAFSVAMLIFAGAIKAIGSIPLKELIKGVVTILGLIAAIASLSVLVSPANMIGLGAALAIIAASLIVFAVGLKILETIPFLKLIGMMAALMLGLLGFGFLAAALTPVLPFMAALAGVLFLIGLAVLAAGAGITMLSAGLTALGIAFTTFGTSLTIGLTSLMSLIPTFFQMLAAGFIAFITGIANEQAALIDAVVKIVGAILDALTQLIPKFCDFLVVLVTELLDLLVELTPVIIDGLIRFFVALVEVGMTYAEKIWPYVHDLLLKIRDGLLKWGADAIEAVKTLGRNIVNGIKSMAKDMLEAGKQLISGLIEGIKSKIEDAVNAVKELGGRVIDKIKNVFDEHSPSRVAHGIGEFFDLGLMNGIRDTSHRVVSAAAKMGDATVNMLKRTISNIADVIANDDYQPTITPVLDLSNIEEGRQTLKDLLDNQNGGSYTASIVGRLSSISGKINHPDKSDQPTNITNNYNMTQNNTSPKALSASDIYRNTKSQFAQLKGAISNA